MKPIALVCASAFLLVGCFTPEDGPSIGGTTGATTSATLGDESSGAADPSGETLESTTASTTTTPADDDDDDDDDTTDAGDTAGDDDTTTDTTATPDATTDARTEESTDTGNPACVVDGMIGDGEECDDDNEVDGDGCSDCWFEDGWACANEPSLCFPACNPLVDDCGAGNGCYAADPTWACVPDGSGASGAQSDACMNLNGCDPGLMCVNSDVVTGCEPGGGCCTAVCDVTAPVCPTGMGCAQFYDVGDAPPGLEDVGVCI
ncbi:MAG TPA: hypothetical protein VFG69_14465 [Nannocystaceae bacterium]|nr:hypothetical protein [Nannocystaceae bacterium]